jgi:hypothetical protein
MKSKMLGKEIARRSQNREPCVFSGMWRHNGPVNKSAARWGYGFSGQRDGSNRCQVINFD